MTKFISKTFWGYILGAVTILGLLATVYFGIIYEKESSIKFEIISNTNVIDVHEELGKLDILYDGVNIMKNKESLSIISFKIVNDGQIDILKSFYDENDPLGFMVSEGRIIDKPELILTSNDYLKKNVKLFLDSTSKVRFSNVILERNQFFIVKVQVIHTQDVVPDINPIGKVAGVKQINLTKPYLQEKERSVWAEIFEGKIYIQVIRILAYTVILILILVIVIYPSTKISSLIKKSNRKRLVRDFKRKIDFEENKEVDFIFDSYIENNYGYLHELRSILILPPDKIKILLQEGSSELRKSEIRELIERDEIYTKSGGVTLPFYLFERDKVIKDLSERGIVKLLDTGKVEINSTVSEMLEQFIKYVDKKDKDKTLSPQL